jgi:hypothetical protein
MDRSCASLSALLTKCIFSVLTPITSFSDRRWTTQAEALGVGLVIKRVEHILDRHGSLTSTKGNRAGVIENRPFEWIWRVCVVP